jgi:hypothetical protein
MNRRRGPSPRKGAPDPPRAAVTATCRDCEETFECLESDAHVAKRRGRDPLCPDCEARCRKGGER